MFRSPMYVSIVYVCDCSGYMGMIRDSPTNLNRKPDSIVRGLNKYRTDL